MVNRFDQDIAKSEVSPSKESKPQLMEVSMDGELYCILFTFRTIVLISLLFELYSALLNLLNLNFSSRMSILYISTRSLDQTEFYFHSILQDGAEKLAKLVYKSNNYVFCW